MAERGRTGRGRTRPGTLTPSQIAESGGTIVGGSVAPVSVPMPITGPTEAPGGPAAPDEDLPPGLSAERPERPLAPPDANQPDIPPSMQAQINSFVEESKRTAGPQAIELGDQLLASTNTLLRVAGVAVLSANSALDEAKLQSIAADEDPAVALNALGWLLDNGDSVASSTLSSLLAQRGLTATDLVNMIDNNDLIASGSRAALEMLASDLSADEARDVFGSISEDETHQYSVRMKATMLLRETLDFESFRNEVSRLQSQASAEDPLWQEGITRLATSIQGPAEVQGGPATLTASDVDEILAREYPMTLEDLAQKLEYVVSQDNAYIAQGTASRLNDRIEELKKLPWTEDQQTSLARIETIAAQLPALEKAPSQAPQGIPEPPPGAAE